MAKKAPTFKKVVAKTAKVPLKATPKPVRMPTAKKMKAMKQTKMKKPSNSFQKYIFMRMKQK